MRNIYFGITMLFFIPLVLAITNETNQINFTLEENTTLNKTIFEDMSNEKKMDFIVVFKDKIDKPLLEQGDIKIKESFDSIDVSIVKATQEDISEIKDSPKIESIEPDLDLILFGTEDLSNLNNEQIIPWGIERVNASNVWNKVTGRNIKIAVLDTGINKNHSDLKDNINGGVSFINDTDYWDDDLGHGTSVAGVIAAENNDIGIVGVAPESEIYSVKIMGASGGKLSNLIQGIQWAIDNHMDIITMSLGVTVDSPSLRRIVDEAYLSGVILVAASGKNNEIYYPAKYHSVIAVGSIDKNNKLTSDSGVGEELEFVAPGRNIISTSIDGYNMFDGTSMAAPHVVGVLALLKENNPILSPNELRAKLQRDTIDLGESGKDNNYGYGLVNIDLSDENLTATIQFIFPEEENQTKKEELEINPIKVEIVKVNNEEEKIVHTLFYDGNQRLQNISVEEGEYKVKQYLDEQIFIDNYNVSEGDIIVVPLHKVNPPVHQWIAYQARWIWTTQEIDNYIFKNNYNDILDSSGYSSDEGVLIGAGEEDEDETDPIYCGGSYYPYNKPFCWHFWDPDIPQNGNYNVGWTDPIYGTQYGSSYTKALYLWNNKVIPLYNSGNKNEAYYWLGRVVHLLEDATVPAHTHDDTHVEIGGVDVNDDEYEDFFSDYSTSWNDGLSNWQHFIGSNYWGQQYNYENINLPLGVKTNPTNLFKLFWYTTQKTQYYASDDVSGNSDYRRETGSSAYLINPSLWQSESVTIFSNPSDLENGWGSGNIPNLKKEAEALIPHSMKAIAGLYRLFWVETKDQGCPAACCDSNHYKTSGQQPTGYNDYYYLEGTNSPTGTSYINIEIYFVLAIVKIM